MSYSLVINSWIWQGVALSDEFEGVLNSVREAADDELAVLKVEAFSGPGSSSAMIEPGTSTQRDILGFLKNEWADDRAINIELGFPLFEDKSRAHLPCNLRFYGKKYGYNHNARFGDIEMAFENVAAFAGMGEARNLERSAKAKNFSILLRMVKGLATEVQLDHLLISTSDTEVNPLTSHLVFHSRWLSFVEDLQVIASLHVHGGLYGRLDVLHFSPWNVSRHYGHLRRDWTDERFAEYLENVDRLAAFFTANNNIPHLSEHDIERVLRASVGVTVQSLPSGVLAYSEYGPSSYMDDVYWSLFRELSRLRRGQ